MILRPADSLKRLIRRYQLALLLVLMAAAGCGVAWASFWQSGYQRSLRFNELLVEAQAVKEQLGKILEKAEAEAAKATKGAAAAGVLGRSPGIAGLAGQKRQTRGQTRARHSSYSVNRPRNS